MRMTKDATEVLKLYLKVADALYATQENAGIKFTKGRLKFRKDVKRAVHRGMAALTTLDTIFKYDDDNWIRVSSIKREFKKFYKEVRKC